MQRDSLDDLVREMECAGLGAVGIPQHDVAETTAVDVQAAVLLALRNVKLVKGPAKVSSRRVLSVTPFVARQRRDNVLVGK